MHQAGNKGTSGAELRVGSQGCDLLGLGSRGSIAESQRAGQDQQHFLGIGSRNSMQPVALEAVLSFQLSEGCRVALTAFLGVAHAWDWVNKLQISFMSSCGL